MISLNYRDARPIYEQVRDGLRHLVITGAIAQGETLPPVGALAASLAINPNTIRRAYAALEEEGYIASGPQEGVYAAQKAGTDDPRREELLRQFDALAEELLFLGMTAEELARRVEAAGNPSHAGETDREGGDAT